MAEAKNKAKDDKVMDVAKPAGAKRALMSAPPADPDAETLPSAETETKAPTVPSASKVKIEPISKLEDLKPESKPKPDTAASNDETDTDTDDIDDTTSEGRDKLKDASQEEQELQTKKAAERQSNIDKIAVSKTYYLPINQVVRRRSKQVAIAGAALILLLGIAWVDVSLDAGLISIPGVKAPTHFFSK